jgi:hypothetical protein
MTRSGVADQPARTNQFLRPFPPRTANLLNIFDPWEKLLDIFRQVPWLLTAWNLPSQLITQLRTLWRANAREMTLPWFHHSKRPRKSKAPRPL